MAKNLFIKNHYSKKKIFLQVFFKDNTNERSNDILPNLDEKPIDLNGKTIDHLNLNNDPIKKLNLLNGTTDTYVWIENDVICVVAKEVSGG